MDSALIFQLLKKFLADSNNKEHLVIGHHQAPAAEFKVDVEELVVVAPAQANQSCGCAGLDVAGAAFAQV